MNGTSQFDPIIAVLGSLMFCAAPLYFAAYAANRRLGWRTDQLAPLVMGMLLGIVLFVVLLLTLGPNGIYAAIAGSIGWLLGFWNAARRNDVRRRFYRSRPIPRKQTQGSTRQE
jgi:hypothetical protein